MTITGTIELAGLDGGHHTLTSEQLEALDSRVQGRLLVAGDQGWNDAVSIWNGMAARLPALVLQPASTQDVAAAVGFARDHGLRLSVKGGGHNIAGTSVVEGGLMRAQLQSVLNSLGEREAAVVRMRYGLDGGQPKTLDEIGRAFKLSRERIRQIERETMAKLRHPSRSQVLRDYLS